MLSLIYDNAAAGVKMLSSCHESSSVGLEKQSASSSG